MYTPLCAQIIAPAQDKYIKRTPDGTPMEVALTKDLRHPNIVHTLRHASFNSQVSQELWASADHFSYLALGSRLKTESATVQREDLGNTSLLFQLWALTWNNHVTLKDGLCVAMPSVYEHPGFVSL